MQHALKCSGWESPCHATIAGEEPPAEDAAAIAHGCPPSCPAGLLVHNVTTCKSKVHDEIHSHFPVYLAADLALSVVCLLCLCCAVSVRRAAQRERDAEAQPYYGLAQ